MFRIQHVFRPHCETGKIPLSENPVFHQVCSTDVSLLIVKLLQTIHILNGWLNASSTFYKWNAILALISMWMNVAVINLKREPFPLVSTIVYLL